MVGNHISDILRDLPYNKDEPLWGVPQNVHYGKVRGDAVEIIEVKVGEWEGSLVAFENSRETQFVLDFKKGV